MYGLKVNLLLFIWLFLLFSFKSKYVYNVYKYKSTPSCKNLNLHIGLAFPDESVFLYFNDELILRYQIDSLDGYHFSRGFCLQYADNDSIRIMTEYEGKPHIDEVFFVEDAFNYQLSVSAPHPENWEELFKEWQCLRGMALEGSDVQRAVAIKIISVNKRTYLEELSYELIENVNFSEVEKLLAPIMSLCSEIGKEKHFQFMLDVDRSFFGSMEY